MLRTGRLCSGDAAALGRSGDPGTVCSYGSMGGIQQVGRGVVTFWIMVPSLLQLRPVSGFGFWVCAGGAAVLAVRDEAEGAGEGTVAAIIRMGADAFCEASEHTGEAAVVGLVAGVAEGTQGDFRGQRKSETGKRLTIRRRLPAMAGQVDEC